MALYDPNEFPETVAPATDFTLADVLAWARTKPADEEYDFFDANMCAIAQFGLATNRPGIVDAPLHDIYLACPGVVDIAAAGDWTFGAFADRLGQALAR